MSYTELMQQRPTYETLMGWGSSARQNACCDIIRQHGYGLLSVGATIRNGDEYQRGDAAWYEVHTDEIGTLVRPDHFMIRRVCQTASVEYPATKHLKADQLIELCTSLNNLDYVLLDAGKIFTPNDELLMDGRVWAVKSPMLAHYDTVPDNIYPVRRPHWWVRELEGPHAAAQPTPDEPTEGDRLMSFFFGTPGKR